MVKRKFKQTEIGLIPEDWDIFLLEKITTQIGDGIHSTPIYSDNKDYYFINGNNLSNGRILISNTTKTVDEKEFRKYYKNLNGYTLLLSINGTIGNLSFFKDEPIILGKSVCYLTFEKKRISKAFAYYILGSKLVLDYFEDNLTGTTIKNLGLSTVRKTPIPLPSLPEQEAIAEALSDADGWIESLGKLIAKKRLLKQGAMQQLLSPKEDWEVVRLGDYAKLKNGFAFSSSNFSEKGPILITPGNFKVEGGMKFQTDKIIRYEGIYPKEMVLSNGDLVIVMTDLTPDCNLLGKAGIINTEELILHNQRIGKIECSNNIYSKYLCYFFNSETFSSRMKNTATGSTVRHTSTSTINNTILSLPAFAEQTRIATILSDMDAEIEALENKLQKARQVKQGMMQQLLTGKVRLVREVV